MRKRTKKLALSKETLRALEPERLQDAEGGDPICPRSPSSKASCFTCLESVCLC